MADIHSPTPYDAGFKRGQSGSRYWPAYEIKCSLAHWLQKRPETPEAAAYTDGVIDGLTEMLIDLGAAPMWARVGGGK